MGKFSLGSLFVSSAAALVFLNIASLRAQEVSQTPPSAGVPIPEIRVADATPKETTAKPVDPAIRAALDAQAAQIGTPGMHALLTQIDPITAARLPPNDSQRIQRALEIYQLTGQPMSALLTNATPPTLPFALLTIALEPSERSILHQRIATRFDAMLDAAQPNLLDEVTALRARGDLTSPMNGTCCTAISSPQTY